MKITIKDLEKKGVFLGGIFWFIENFGENAEVDVEDLKSKLINQKKYYYLECFYITFKLSGEYIQYWKNENIYKKCFYINGKLEGEYIEYWENRNIREKIFYKNNKLNGEYIKYGENGEIMEKSYWKNGVKIK